jgi:hypothetical protein
MLSRYNPLEFRTLYIKLFWSFGVRYPVVHQIKNTKNSPDRKTCSFELNKVWMDHTRSSIALSNKFTFEFLPIDFFKKSKIQTQQISQVFWCLYKALAFWLIRSRLAKNHQSIFCVISSLKLYRNCKKSLSYAMLFVSFQT